MSTRRVTGQKTSMPGLASPPDPSADSELDRAAEQALALARALAAPSERERRLTDELIDRLRASGLMRACAPRGAARPVDVGLRVSGRWAYGSGITHSDCLFAGLLLEPDAITAATQGPILRVVAIPVGELEILDTWHASGLRETGSHDTVADDVFVPAHRTLSFTLRSPDRRHPGVPLSDLQLLCAVDRGRRARVYQAIDDAWQAPRLVAPRSVDLRVGLRLAATHAVRTAAQAARLAARGRSTCGPVCGWRRCTRSGPRRRSRARCTTSVAAGQSTRKSPLQRRLRDAYAATAHLQVDPTSWQLTGRLLLSQPTQKAML